MEEYFDVVDKADKVVGCALRSECHKNPKLIHRGVEVIILNDKEEILLSKRSMEKDTNPGKWEIMGEHNKPGESYRKAALRGLKEELGIKGKIRKISKFFYKTNKESEFNEIYICKISKTRMKFDKKEVSDARFFGLKKAEKIIRTKKATLCTKLVFGEYKKYLDK